VNVIATGPLQNEKRRIAAGGAVGYSDGCNLDQVYVTDDCQGNSNSISSTDAAGGLVGLVGAGLTVNNSYAIASISAYNAAGGLIGREFGTTTISNSYANFTLVGTAANAGELIGFQSKASTFTNCYYVVQSRIPIIGNKPKNFDPPAGVQPYALGAYPNFDPSVWKGDRLEIENLTCSANFQNLVSGGCNFCVGVVGSNSSTTTSNPTTNSGIGTNQIMTSTTISTSSSSCSPTNKRDNTNTNTTSFSYQVVIANQNVIFSIPSFNFSLSLVCKNGQCSYSGSSLALVPSSASSVQFLLSLVVSLCLLNLI